MLANQSEEILTILANDARTSVANIATLVGAKEEEVRAEIADLEKRGVIKRYKTIVDWEKIGVDTVFAFIDVKVIPARDVGFDSVAERIYRYPEVQSVWLVSGGFDLRIVVEGHNIRELGRFVAEKLAVIEGVQATDTHFLLKRYKEDGDFFVDIEDDERLVVAP
jgi:DNA-binding Lrp family transcriptional regulator